ncbi:MAG: class I SAM-dependent DNA methyltransferase [Polyangiales bacterium]
MTDAKPTARVDVVAKLWGYCHVLRHDGIGYQDYVMQLTYLIFLKMADERKIKLPPGCSWTELKALNNSVLLDGEEDENERKLVKGYQDILRTLARQATPLLKEVFTGATSLFRKAVSLRNLIELIDGQRWTAMGVDVKAEIYEGLLEKAASEGKKGAGQYFTPRPLIRSIVRCMKPDPAERAGFKLCDPACGTGGFLVAAYEWWAAKARGGDVDRALAARVRKGMFYGNEIGVDPRRLAVMNLVLHGVEPAITQGDSIYENPSAERFDVVLTNPPFGTKGADAAPEREDFLVETKNKQLNFVQHVMTVLRDGGRAAVVLPDNCLFGDQAGEVFKDLMAAYDLHTVIRLPRGTFTPYAQGVKANVIFFTRGSKTDRVWIYDARTNVPGITKKSRPLTEAHFAEFERCFGADPNGRSPRKTDDSKDDRWRSFTRDEVEAAGWKLDGFRWLKEEGVEDVDDLPEPDELLGEMMGDLEAALTGLKSLTKTLDAVEHGAP